LFFSVISAQQIVNLLGLFLLRNKNKIGGSHPAIRLTFVQAATKVSKSALLLAEGIFLRQLSELFTIKGFRIPARFWGLSVFLSSSKKRNSRGFGAFAEVEVLKGLVKTGGSVA